MTEVNSDVSVMSLPHLFSTQRVGAITSLLCDATGHAGGVNVHSPCLPNCFDPR